MKAFSFIDLFGAPGGMSLGFKMAGLKPLATVDVSKEGLETFAANFPEVPRQNIIEADASSDNVLSKFKAITSLQRGDIDVIIGGPPCQGFSTIGRIKIANLVKNGQRTGRSANPRFIDDPRNNLYKAFIKFVRYYKPKAVVMENVLGMVSYKDGDVVKEIKNNFKNVGYKNVDYRILNAADYGTPQKRRRIFFIGTRSESEIKWPKQTHFAKSDFDRSVLSPNLKEYVSVGDAIGDLPAVPAPHRGLKISDVVLSYPKKAISDYQRWARENSTELHNHISRWHRDIDVKIFSTMGQGQTWIQLPAKYRKKIGYSDESFDDKWKKLVWDEPSWTIVSHLHKDGYMYIHPKKPRTISVREAARLQGFPDSFVFLGHRTAQFKQVGNAVPPLMAESVGKQLLKML